MRKIETNICHYRDPVKLVQASLCVREDVESIFQHCRSPCVRHFECAERFKQLFSLLWRRCDAVA